MKLLEMGDLLISIIQLIDYHTQGGSTKQELKRRLIDLIYKTFGND